MKSHQLGEALLPMKELRLTKKHAVKYFSSRAASVYFQCMCINSCKLAVDNNVAVASIRCRLRVYAGVLI